MSTLFIALLNMSISANWLILAVLFLRLVLKRAPKWITVLLWGMVAVRLICPFSIECVLSLIPNAEVINPGILIETPVLGSSPIVNSILDPIMQESIATTTPEKSIPAFKLFVLLAARIWVIGVTLLLIFSVVSYRHLHRKVETAVLYRGNIFQSEHVSAPFVLGIIKPRIYLPFDLNASDLDHIVAHEQAHIQRKDHWWKPLGFLLLTVHWFNPLVWLAYILLCRDIELACDESVIKKLDSEQKADYAQTLVSCSTNRPRIAACPLAFGGVGAKGRVKAVMHYKKPGFWLILLGILSCAVIAVCFLTDPVSNDPNTVSFLREPSVFYCVTGYLRRTAQTEISEAYNQKSEPLFVTVIFESSEGPAEIEFAYRYKESAASGWIYSTPKELLLGESSSFTVPAYSHFTVMAEPLSGANGNVTFAIEERPLSADRLESFEEISMHTDTPGFQFGFAENPAVIVFSHRNSY